MQRTQTVELSPRSPYRRTTSDAGDAPATKSNLRFVPTLLRKNWWLKTKNPRSLAFELLLPALFVLLLGIIKHQTTDYDVPAGFSDDDDKYNLFDPTGGDGDALVAPSFAARYAVQETSLTGLLLHMSQRSFDFSRGVHNFEAAKKSLCQQELVFGGRVSLNTSSPYALPESCEGRVSPFKLAIAPDVPFTRQYFYETVAKWYPTVSLNVSGTSSLVVSSLADSVVFYDTEKDLETYVKSNDYAKNSSQPRIFGAIVFDQFPTDDAIGSYAPIEYTLRLNSTYTGNNDDVRYVPQTVDAGASAWDQFQRSIGTKTYQQYAAGGFMTLQTLVARFVNCMPAWSKTNQSTTGVCQATNAVAKTSDELDARFLKTITQDPAIMQVASALAGTTSVNITVSSNAKETVVTPLRLAPQPYLGSLTSPFPVDNYTKSTFYDITENLFPIFFIMTNLTTLSKILVSLISERETRARELMKILGVKESSIVLSWYITYITIILIASVLQVIAARAGLFVSSNIFVVFLFFFLFNLSILGYSFMVSSVFSKARTGAYVGIIGFFLLYAVSNAFNDSSSESSKQVASLLSPTAMVFAVQTLAKSETTHVGINFSNLSTSINNYKMSTALLLLAVDAVLYTVIGLYLEKVVPMTYGTAEKWYFPLSPSYWRKRRDQSRRPAGPLGEMTSDVTVPVNPNIETVSADLAEQELNDSALCVQGLRKVFSVPGGEKVAVKNLHLNMYSGQITCLLGHNGAGKTTLISMLTGVLEASAGDATFRGLSIRQDMDELRESLGICFQHDVLYPMLTVAEHLDFYARIKGFTGEALTAEVDNKIAEVGLKDKRNVLSSALSGGMKRKLSVAISLLGDSSLVFLDEPTSGMDPYSRRSTWEILMNNRQNRVLVLTTHFMDEADILGDRIAIMAEGDVRCCGSSLFLKNRYGAGYNLTIVKQEGCDDSRVLDFIMSRIPSGRLLSNVGAEISFQLPLDTSTEFPELFRTLDTKLDALQLLSYGISVTTLEEVFIKVAEAADDEHNQQHTLQNKVKLHEEMPSTPKAPSARVEPRDLFFAQFRAIFQKRFRVAKRDRKYVMVSLLLPVSWLIIGLSLLEAGELTKQDPKIVLSTDGLLAKTPNDQIILPSYCQTSSGDWCSSVLDSSSVFTGATPVKLDDTVIGNPPYPQADPTVFGVHYTSPTIDPNDATGYLLRLSEAVYTRGYNESVEAQFAAFLAHSDSNTSVLSYNVLVNTTVTHGAAIFKGLMDQSIYRVFAKQASPSMDVGSLSLKLNNHPLPQTASTTALMSGFLSLSACIFIAIAMGYYPASIVVFLVNERHPDHNAKHQQLVSGVSLQAFWLANFAWDYLVYLIPAGFSLALIQAYDLSALTGSSKCVNCASDTFTAVVVLFVLFGVAVVPYAYAWSFAFRDGPAAQTKMVLINFVLGLVLLILSYILDSIDSTYNTNQSLKWIYRFSPIYSLADGLVDLAVLSQINGGSKQLKSTRPTEPFALDNAGYEMIFLIIDAVIFFTLAVGMDFALTFPKVKALVSKDPHTTVERELLDEDVAAEAERVNLGRADGDMIVLKGLRKVYPKGGKVAVKNLSFGLPRGECFGFLGINGAGKTTTMKMLTGDIVPTSGSATLAGFDILSQQLDVRREIGYCPQFDALIDLLSVREHLELFAQIKGVSADELDAVVKEKMTQLNLLDFENKLAGSLSGGNKRKLSVAIAMIGSPSILFLDEPSTGMDPVSRRFMWDVISEISTYNKQSTVVLTTHSMEECEALCTRVGIMVGGGLQCLGSIQHLKSRFGDGLMLDAKLLAPAAADVSELALRHFASLDTRIARSEIRDAFTRLGKPTWEAKLVNTHPTGYAVVHALDRDEYVLASTLATWWLGEQRYEALTAFLKKNFSHNVELLEHRNDSCWFKIRADEDDALAVQRLRLSNVFAAIESSKAQLGVREYNVSQTTLEQIFNAFASKQGVDEPIPTTPVPVRRSGSSMPILG